MARTLFPPLMCVFGTAWVFYALEWGGVVRVRRSLPGGIAVVVIILIVWALIVLSSYRFVFASSRETVIAGSYPEFLEKLFGVYIFWFNNYVGMFVSQVMGFGLFWAIGKRQKT